MSIRHAILGLLAERPMHGYRLKKVFDRKVSPLWGLTTGQIYQTLAALERNALVESRSERKGRRPGRRIYSLTPSGERDLASWLQTTPVLPGRPFRDDIFLRLMLLQAEDAPRLSSALRRREEESAKFLERVALLRDDHRLTSRVVDVGGSFLACIAAHLEADIKATHELRAEIDRWMRQLAATSSSSSPFEEQAAS